PVTNPRATSGDLRHGPKWDELFTLTVGNANGDLNGTDQRVIQAAVDTVARTGGGTVRLLPDTFRLRNAVYLCSNVRLVGSSAAPGADARRGGGRGGRGAGLRGGRRRLPTGDTPTRRRSARHTAPARPPARHPVQVRQGAAREPVAGGQPGRAPPTSKLFPLP